LGGVVFKPQRTEETGEVGWVGGVVFKPQRAGETGEVGERVLSHKGQERQEWGDFSHKEQ
jgi:hypothetical protein